MAQYYAGGFGIGVCLSIIWVISLIISRAGFWVWAWLNDSEPPKRNLLVYFVMTKIFEYDSDKHSTYPYYHDKYSESDGTIGALLPILIFILSPIAIVTIIDLYKIVFISTGLVATAFLTRLAFRQKKLLSKHIDDSNAHDKEK